MSDQMSTSLFRLSSHLSLCAASNLQVGEDVGKYKHLKLQEEDV